MIKGIVGVISSAKMTIAGYQRYNGVFFDLRKSAILHF